MHYSYYYYATATTQINDTSTLQFIASEVTQLHAHLGLEEQWSSHHTIRQISGHIRFRPDFKNWNPVYPTVKCIPKMQLFL